MASEGPESQRLESRDPADIGEPLALAAMALARRLAAGATLWCVAPEWPEHARHVAVEFVHPVIVGKRALPAVSVQGPDAVAALRPLVRVGDAVLAVSPGHSTTTLALMRRAEAWGVMTIWIGHGDRAATAAADHVLWVDDDDQRCVHDGRLVLRYHVLWELTHVCFEHPGLLIPSSCEPDEVCITCSDEGRLGEIIVAGTRTASVRTARGVETIDTMIVDPLAPGDLVLIHAGSAISVVDG